VDDSLMCSSIQYFDSDSDTIDIIDLFKRRDQYAAAATTTTTTTIIIIINFF
jgi:hypothetical protein